MVGRPGPSEIGVGPGVGDAVDAAGDAGAGAGVGDGTLAGRGVAEGEVGWIGLPKASRSVTRVRTGDAGRAYVIQAM